MLSIILCDDDPFILQLGGEKIREQIEQNHFEAQIVCQSTKSAEILYFLKQNPAKYLVFLDLDFGSGHLNGIDVARQIKKENRETKIVFVTNHQEMAMQVLSSGVEPFGFLEKTTDMKSLAAGYRKYIRMALGTLHPMSKKRDMICLQAGVDEEVFLERSQIVYLESDKTISHGISYHTLDGSCVTVRDTMEHCRQVLGGEFLRIHRSILANRNYMVGIHGTMVHMSNGEVLPCSVRMLGEVKKWLKK